MIISKFKLWFLKRNGLKNDRFIFRHRFHSRFLKNENDLFLLLEQQLKVKIIYIYIYTYIYIYSFVFFFHIFRILSSFLCLNSYLIICRIFIF